MRRFHFVYPNRYFVAHVYVVPFRFFYYISPLSWHFNFGDHHGFLMPLCFIHGLPIIFLLQIFVFKKPFVWIVNCFYFKFIFMIFLLYIWSDHYAHKDVGWRLFDHKKNIVVAGCSPAVAGCFCWPFSLFVTFCYFFLLLVTFVNYFLLLKVQCLLFFYCL
jgi:hypothetical protein